MSTLRSAIELKSVFDQIAAAEKAGNLTPEEKKKLEEQAAEKGIQALFKVLHFIFEPIDTFDDTIRARNLKSSLYCAKLVIACSRT